MKSIIDQYFKEYFVNYSKDKMKLQLLQGLVQFENLIVNSGKVNELLDKLNIPFKIKFGMLKKIKVDVSILGASLEEVDIQDLILVVGPDASLADRNFRLSKEDRWAVLLDLMKSYKQYLDWVAELQELEKNADQAKDGGKLRDKLQKKIKNFKMGRCTSIPSKVYQDMLGQEKKHYNAFAEKGSLSYLTMEDRYRLWRTLFLTIQSLLDAKVRIKNFRIFYEDSRTLRNLTMEKKNVSFCVFFENLILSKVSRLHPANPERSGWR